MTEDHCPRCWRPDGTGHSPACSTPHPAGAGDTSHTIRCPHCTRYVIVAPDTADGRTLADLELQLHLDWCPYPLIDNDTIGDLIARRLRQLTAIARRKLGR